MIMLHQYLQITLSQIIILIIYSPFLSSPFLPLKNITNINQEEIYAKIVFSFRFILIMDFFLQMYNALYGNFCIRLDFFQELYSIN